MSRGTGSRNANKTAIAALFFLSYPPNQSPQQSPENLQRFKLRQKVKKKPLVSTKQAVLHGTPGAIRTHGLWSRSPTLYPAELRAQMCIRDRYNRSDLSEQSVAALLRQYNLLSIDVSGKSTKKIKGKRYLCIPISSLNPGSL